MPLLVPQQYPRLVQQLATSFISVPQTYLTLINYATYR
jgi:hypothetical protein